MQKTYTVDEFAKEKAPDYAKRLRVGRKTAEEGLRNFFRLFLVHTLLLGREIEFPFGSGYFYKKVDDERFTVRYDNARIKRAIKRLEELETVDA